MFIASHGGTQYSEDQLPAAKRLVAAVKWVARMFIRRGSNTGNRDASLAN